MNGFKASLLSAALLLSSPAQPGGFKVRVVRTAPAVGGNEFYVGNRPPLLPSPLIKLPTGAIRPRGWLLRQLLLMRDGLAGRLPEVSKYCKFEGSAWASPRGEGKFGWEELPYWLRGFTSLAYVLHDERLISEARKWLEAIMGSQTEEGYFGPRQNWRNHDLWPNMIALCALRTHYEATGDERVIRLMRKFFRWLTTIPFEHLLPISPVPWQKWRGGDLLDSVYWLYNRTGEEWLLDLARVVHERTADWTGGIPTWHGVNICQGFREPAQFYQQAHDPRYLQAAIRNYRTVMGTYGQVPGGMFAADENCRRWYTGPQQAAETCSMVEFMRSHEMMLGITGDPIWADRCEEIAFNSLPAAFTPDYKALHYLTAPNMVQLDGGNKAPFLQNAGTMLSYDPWRYRCCKHNHTMGWPYFAEHCWMATQRNGLAAVLYAPCEVEAKVGDGTTVRVVEETEYPFGESVKLTICAPKPVRFPLLLRVPGWCDGAEVYVNGERADVEPEPRSFVIVERKWQEGDEVLLRLPMRLRVKVWEAHGGAASVYLGPLAFSLRIGERWERRGGTDRWPAYEVYPETPWNYGLLLDPDEPERSFEVVRRPGPLPEQPFTLDGAPIMLKAKGRRIPEWKMVGGIAGPLQRSPAKSDEPIEELTLVPMGCARLRVSVLPVVGEGPGAVRWREEPVMVRTSHLYDCIYAPFDGIEPKSSGDQEAPRLTWWPHKGTTEWLEYTFERPRRLSWAEVYWFDDRGTGGQCRAPQSWRLLYKEGGEWREVPDPSGYGVDLDKFNRVEFSPIVAKEVRLEVKLRPGFSGGVLEWRVGG